MTIMSSKLDANQVIRQAYDEEAQALRTVGSAATEVTVKQPDPAELNATVVQSDGSQLHVTVDASPLPTGASTEAKQDAGNTSLASIDSKLTSPLAVTGPITDTELRAAPVPVSASSLPLPTGAATEIKQDAANTSLASIDSKLTSPLNVTGPLTDTQLRASAVPVDGSAVTQPVSAASLPLPTGAATQATLAAFSGKTAAGLVPEAYDYQDISYIVAGPGAGEIGMIIYKSGGPSGTIVAQVFLGYDGSNRLISVEKA